MGINDLGISATVALSYSTAAVIVVVCFLYTRYSLLPLLRAHPQEDNIHLLVAERDVKPYTIVQLVILAIFMVLGWCVSRFVTVLFARVFRMVKFTAS